MFSYKCIEATPKDTVGVSIGSWLTANVQLIFLLLSQINTNDPVVKLASNTRQKFTLHAV